MRTSQRKKIKNIIWGQGVILKKTLMPFLTQQYMYDNIFSVTKVHGSNNQEDCNSRNKVKLPAKVLVFPLAL